MVLKSIIGVLNGDHDFYPVNSFILSFDYFFIKKRLTPFFIADNNKVKF
jgi:hypothetical protein